MKFVVVTSAFRNIICVLKADTFYHDALKRALEDYYGTAVTYIPNLTWPEGEGDMIIDVQAEDDGEECRHEVTLTLADLYE